MREILFRAKRVYNNKWFYGYLSADNVITHHCEKTKNKRSYQVHSDTVSQYTGLKDREGKRIFEGDVLSVLVENPYTKPSLLKGEVEITKYGIAFCLGYVYDHEKEVEIIGNRWDNPELLQ